MSTDVPSGAEPAAASLGPGLVHRARSQGVLGRHWSAAGVVGAVGRASVGFGLAVGRSRSIRPSVRIDDLNSAALRPSVDAWRHRVAALDDGASVDAGVVPAAAARPGRELRVPNVARQMTARARPTWTEQVLQRSGAGFTARPAAAPAPSIPDGFVASGDARLDRLRLLVAQQGSAHAPRSTTPSPGDASRRRAPVAEEAGTLSAVTVAPGDTVAGPATGPGRLARSMRPEPIDADGAAPRATPRTASGPAAPGRPSSSPPRSRSRRAGTAAGPDKLEALRATLRERGLLDAGPSPSPSPSSSPMADRSPDPPARPRPATDERRSSSTDSTDSAGPSDSIHSADDPMPATNLARSIDTSANLRRSVTGPATIRSETRSPDVDGAGSAHTASRPPDGPGRIDDPARPPSAVAPGAGPERRGGVGTVDARLLEPADHSSGAGGAAVVTATHQERAARASASRRRIDRLLSTSPTVMRPSEPSTNLERTIADDVFGDDDIAATRRQDAEPTMRPAAAPRSTAAHRDRAPIPVLPSATGSVDTADTAGLTVRRRVTLPRALSFHHRPEPSATPAAARIGPTHEDTRTGLAEPTRPDATTRTVARTAADSVSTTRASRSGASDRRSAPAVGIDERGGVASHARTSTPADASGPPRSIVPPGSGALLEVVRRTAAAEVASTATAPVAAATPAGAPPAGAPPAGPPPAGASSGVEGATSAGRPTVGRPTVGRPIAEDRVDVHQAGRPAEVVAERFMAELSRSVRSRPAPLPTSFRPLADAIAGPRPVMLSTDAASRRALRAVGKVAATTGATIHLDHAAIAAPRLNEVVAHELTHVAAPSPTPRFFDDIDDSPEERRAERVGRLMAASPLAPTSAVLSPARRSTDGDVLRRSPTVAPTPATSPGDGFSRGRGSPSSASPAPSPPPPSPPAVSTPSVTADQLVARYAQASPGRLGPVLRRKSLESTDRPMPTTTTPIDSPSPATTASTGQTNAPATGGASSSSSFAGAPYSVRNDPEAAAWFADQLAEHMQSLLRMIEDRMIVEIERRGGRSWRSV